MINLRELYFEILERLPTEIRDFLLKRGKDILIATVCFIVLYISILSFNQYQHYKEQRAAKELGFALSESDIVRKEALLKEIINKHANTKSATYAKLLLASMQLDIAKWSEAEKLFKELQKELPKNTIFVQTARLGEALSLLHTKKEIALEKLSTIAEENTPYSSFASITLANVYENDQNFDKAIYFYEKFLTQSKNPGEKEKINEKIEYLKKLKI